MSPTLPPSIERPARLRDHLLRFVPISLAIHALGFAPWAALIAAIIHLLGITPPIHLKDVAPGETVIPIDIDDLDESTTPASAPPVATGEPTAGGGDRAGDAAVTDAIGDSPAEAGVVDAAPEASAPPAPKRVGDPGRYASGLDSIKPKSKEVNVSLWLRMDRLREQPIGPELGGLFASIPQWRPFFDGTGIDPVKDVDVIFADGPRFFELSQVTAIIVVSCSDDAVLAAMKIVATKGKDVEWASDTFPAVLRVTLDGAKLVVVQLPGGIVVTNPGAEKQAVASARRLIAKKKRAKDSVPRTDAEVIVSAYLRKPSNVLTAIPEDLVDTRITLRAKKDGTAIADLDAQAKDEKHAKEDVKIGEELVAAYVPKGFLGKLVRKYVDGHKLTSEGSIVHLHHELTGDQIKSIWSLIKLGG
ncbi:MAG: hypothetical protein ACHREM_26250 [Polyangiales bacterium]